MLDGDTEINVDVLHRFGHIYIEYDQGYGRGGTPVFTGVFKPVARVTLYLTDEDGLGTCFGAA